MACIVVFHDIFLSRFMTCSCVLDYNTVAAADKFGNIAIVCRKILSDSC